MRLPWFDKTSRVIQHGKFIPELDGLRFIAIISVLFFHASGRMLNRFELERNWISEFFGTGFFGVEIFFAISGFILTHQFLRAKQFKYSSYLVRRIKRIEPPFVLAIVLQTALLLLINRDRMEEYLSSFVNVITYTSNIFKNNTINGVTWSLEVEVQFYLLLPLLLFMLVKVRSLWVNLTLLTALALILHFLVHPMMPIETSPPISCSLV